MACLGDAADVRALLKGVGLACDDSVIRMSLEQARCIVGPCTDCADLATNLLAAHFCAELADSPDGVVTAGPITSESAGGISRSFGAQSGGADNPYSSTVFGRRYHQIMSANVVPIAITGPACPGFGGGYSSGCC